MIENKSSVILTCKDHLIKYYETFGYVNLGVSSSVHGGAKWYDMVLKI
jgi:putative heme iron utilization protein